MKALSRNFLTAALSAMFFLFVFCTVFFQVEQAFAESTESQQEKVAAQDKAYMEALETALKAAVVGPAKVNLLDQGSINIPNRYLFIPTKEASALMKVSGEDPGSEFIGLIVSKDDDLRWFIVISFIKSGYLRDDDAKSWKADDLLNNIKEGNDEANKDRVANGFPALEIAGWVEPPKYTAAVHQLVWSLLVKDDTDSEPAVNYNTYVLGRDGYFKLDLITPESAINQDKSIAHKMLAALHYNNGKRYEDFSAKTDKVAEYGLAALITGVVAKKIGLLAMAGVFIIKVWKLLIFIPILLWTKIKNLFNKSKSGIR